MIVAYNWHSRLVLSVIWGGPRYHLAMLLSCGFNELLVMLLTINYLAKPILWLLVDCHQSRWHGPSHMSSICPTSRIRGVYSSHGCAWASIWKYLLCTAVLRYCSTSNPWSGELLGISFVWGWTHLQNLGSECTILLRWKGSLLLNHMIGEHSALGPTWTHLRLWRTKKRWVNKKVPLC